jgi:hypothetical protein
MKPMEKMDITIFRTDDRGLAAYALLLGHTCVGCIPSNHKDKRRMDFVFIDIPNPKSLEASWYRGQKILMSPLQFFQCMTTAVHMAKNPLSQEEVEALRG